ncbi:hypothetical protein [Nonomuraea jabiensis]
MEFAERLHLDGGTRLMRHVHEAFGRRTERREANSLTIIWRGRGDWQA